MFDTLVQDVRYALRGLRKSAAFTVIAIVTLTLAIGANTAIFSVVYGVLMRPLPYRDDSRLVAIEGERDYVGLRQPVRASFALTDLTDWQERLQSVESFAFYAPTVYQLSTAAGSEIIDAAMVSDGFFSVLSGRLAAGRTLGPPDDRGPSVVISERLSHRLFGRPSLALGARLTLNSQAYAVIGVADRSFAFPSPSVDVWIPAGYARLLNPRVGGFLPIARLKQGVTIGQARADVGAAVSALRLTNPGSFDGLRATAVGLRDQIVAGVRPALLIIWAAVGLVLLVACANLINLLLARNTARARETAIRFMLGATRRRVLTQGLIDSGLLALAGTAAGLAFGALAIAAIVRLQPAGMPRLSEVQLDLPALFFAAALGVIATLVVGMMPAMQAATSSPSVQVAAAPAHRRLRRGLCVAELAVAIVLLVGATLLGRSLVRLLHTDMGVDTSHVTTASVNLAFGRRHTDADTIQTIDRLTARVRALPGVRAAGVGTSLPPNGGRMRVTLRRKEDKAEYLASAVPSTPGYFQALGVRLRAGRFFTDADDATHPPVIIMSADTARRFFGEADPIGRTLTLPTIRNGVAGGEEMTLVGVIDNVKYSGLAAGADDQVYRPFAQQPWPSVFLAVRTDRDLEGFTSTLRRVIAAVDPTLAVGSIKTLDAIVSETTAPERFRTALLAALAVLALTMATVGLYGVIAYSVSQRTKEIGIRMALGAHAADITRMVLKEAAVLGMTGAAIGIAGAYAMTRGMAALLFGVTTTDPASFAGPVAFLVLVTLAASYAPSRRAARVEPLAALRSE